ncbi:ArnT family glycosyltransferase [Solilutibacter silvestris]|uniref:Dolichyl-phosphate-mannose-protein mannosyltransferase n=1 Tax=Solilutibacter silvestris TaxID=1645665 RepID=A0A2K1Q201_9GAMM|nr:glycosyltransferase family 39 protein [Lysobacter silvestris]PNS09063.1 Dolichyl-phosphate-mannose-protein mannosyltransferase [Lysobacter silvestris]
MSVSTSSPFDQEEARIAPWLILLVIGTLLYRIGFVWAHDYSLFVDEAQYWLWSRAPAFGYYSKPPMVAWMVRISTALLGDGELGIKLPALLAYPLAALALYRLGTTVKNARVGLIAAALFLSMPGQALAGWVLSPDALLLVAWSWSLWLLWMARTQQQLKWWLGLGVVVGLGALSKYTMLAFVPLAAWVLWRGRAAVPVRGKGPWLALAIVLLLIAPNIVWNIQNHFETVRHTVDLTNADQAGLHPRHLLEFVGAQWGIFGMLAFPLLVMLMVCSRRDRSDITRFLAAFTIPYLLAIIALSLVTLANANWAVTVYAAGSVWLAIWLDGRRPAWAWSVILLNFVLQLGLLHYRDIGTRLGHPPSHSGRDLYARVLGWRELGRALQPITEAQGGLPILSSDRMLLAELDYYLQPRPYPVAALDVDGKINNQYEADTARRGLPQEALWVQFVGGQDGSHHGENDGDAPNPPALTRAYDVIEDLGVVRVQRMDAPPRSVQIVRVRRHVTTEPLP